MKQFSQWGSNEIALSDRPGTKEYKARQLADDLQAIREAEGQLDETQEPEQLQLWPFGLALAVALAAIVLIIWGFHRWVPFQ